MTNTGFKPGNEIYIRQGGSSRSFIKAVVVKITPKGFMDVTWGTLSEPRRFNPDGYEVSQFKSSRYYLMTLDLQMTVPERDAYLAKEQRGRIANNAVRELVAGVGDYCFKPEDLNRVLDKLQADLNAARALVAEINGPCEPKFFGPEGASLAKII
jgi:hypothetical protein